MGVHGHFKNLKKLDLWNNYIFQQDRDPKHTSKQLNFPLYAIKNLWEEFKCIIRKDITNKNILKSLIQGSI